eukprot:2481304-Pyramimonas_sp.AAC.1
MGLATGLQQKAHGQRRSSTPRRPRSRRPSVSRLSKSRLLARLQKNPTLLKQPRREPRPARLPSTTLNAASAEELRAYLNQRGAEALAGGADDDVEPRAA